MNREPFFVVCVRGLEGLDYVGLRLDECARVQLTVVMPQSVDDVVERGREVVVGVLDVARVRRPHHGLTTKKIAFAIPDGVSQLRRRLPVRIERRMFATIDVVIGNVQRGFQ